MFVRVSTLIIAIATICSADSLTLRSGRVVHGQYLGWATALTPSRLLTYRTYNLAAGSGLRPNARMQGHLRSRPSQIRHPGDKLIPSCSLRARLTEVRRSRATEYRSRPVRRLPSG